ncbi:MAG: cell division protein FtsX [Microgenomates group bacterium]
MKEFFLSLKRTPYQTLSAFLSLFFTLFISTLILIGVMFFYGLLNYVETRPQVTVYFQTNVSENHIFKIRDDLIASGKVANIKYISQKEAYEIYKKLNKDNPLLLEMVSPEILPASLEIFTKKPFFLPEIAEYLKKQPGVDEVQFQKDIIDRLLTLTNILRIICLAFFVFLVMTTGIILITTTSFKIALKKEEIELLKLIGATNFYIRKPFLKENLFLGLFASLLSTLIIFGLIFYFQPFINSYLRGITNLYISIREINLTIWPINLIFLLVVYIFSLSFALIISLSATYIATGKYLK